MGPIRQRCPLMLDLLWAPVSREDSLYGFLYTEPVLPTGRSSDHEHAGDNGHSSGKKSKALTELGPRMAASFERILRVKATQRDGLLLLLNLVAQRLACRFHEQERLPASHDPSEVLVKRAKTVLCSMFHESISTSDIADELHVSESHLCHAFHRVTGGTLIQYLNELRFSEACRLLREYPRLSVSEVAFAAGFRSISRFSEQFRRRNLPSPGKWRQSFAGLDGTRSPHANSHTAAAKSSSPL